MGDLLFYLLKSGCYLIIFYLLFKLLMSGTTFFRFNRVTLLVGVVGCMFLPLIEFTTEKETFLTVPLQAIQEILVERTDGVFLDKMMLVEPIADRTGAQDINWWPIVLGYLYLAGGIFTLSRILLSFYRMFQLIRTGERHVYGKYKLIVVSDSISSFCWGNYIVVSASDYNRQIDEILLHETMHLRNRHTLDLLLIKVLLVFYWFNPAIWLLKRELHEIHEFEADTGVLNAGIDATRYQLLLVKKAVGTRLYSMANGFNHSKLKKRITMMLKERTNRWARLKLLFVVPVMGGALYAFAQPEVKNDLGLNAVQEVLQSKPEGGDQDIFQFVVNESDAYYERMKKAGKKTDRVFERQVHIVNIEDDGRLTLGKKEIAKKDLKEALKKRMLESKQFSKQEYNRNDDQMGTLFGTTNTPEELAEELLTIMKDAFVEIRADIAKKTGNDSKEFLDKEFPIVISYWNRPLKYGKETSYSTPANEKITNINLKLISKDGKVEKEFSNFTLAELEKELKDFKATHNDNMDSYTVGMKVDKKCPMGIVTDVKTALRKSYLLKLNFQQ